MSARGPPNLRRGAGVGAHYAGKLGYFINIVVETFELAAKTAYEDAITNVQ